MPRRSASADGREDGTLARVRGPEVRRRSQAPSLARQLLLLQALVVTVIVAAATGAAYLSAQQTAEREAEVEVRALVAALTQSPVVLDAVTGPRPTEVLQPYVEEVLAETSTSFITVSGRTFTETFTGTLGPSVRATGPVVDGDGDVVAIVSAGITLDAIGADFARSLPGIVGAGLLTLAAGTTGSWLISRRLRRQTRGLGAPALARMVDHHQAVLHAVREGLLLVDGEQRVQLANDEARRLLDLADDPAGRHVRELGLSAELTDLLLRQEQAVDEVQVSGDRVLVVNQSPAETPGHIAGVVVTLRDHTELQALTGELASLRAFAESLRAQAHEADNRLHTTVSLIELGRGQDAVDFATAALASAQQLTDRVVDAVEAPVLAALLLGKSATAHERGVRLEIDPGTAARETGIPSGELVTIVGNLLDNAIDAALAGEPPREVQFAAWVEADRLEIRVEDSGPGVGEEQLPHLFERGWTTKAEGGLPSTGMGWGLGLTLVRQAVRRNGGSVTVDAGPGARFCVSLPVRTPVEVPAGERA